MNLTAAELTADELLINRITKPRVLVAEDHAIVREGLKALLMATSRYEVVGEARDGLEAVELASTLKPDVILLDLSMPKMHGLEAIDEIRKRAPNIKIVITTVHREEEYINACIKAGANGYFLKDSGWSELTTAINAVLSGRTYFCSEIVDKIVMLYSQDVKVASPHSSWDQLTHRERQILKLIAEGMTNKRIAESLGISVKTVEKHRANLMDKLNLHSTAALTAFAVRRGLVAENLATTNRPASGDR